MRNLISFVAVLLLFISCSHQSQRTRIVEKTLPIENFVDAFIRHNPNYALNDITKQETNELFRDILLDTLRENNLLHGIPMQLDGINKVRNSTVVHLRTWLTKPYKWKYKGALNEVNVDILASVSDSLIYVLEDGAYYCIHGHLIERINNLTVAQLLFGKNIYVYNNLISIEKDDIWDNKVNVDLGMLYYSIDSLSRFVGREVDTVRY